MNLIERSKAILLSPKDTWPLIAQEASSPAQLYTRYLMWLAAIPAIAAFIGFSVVGTSVFGVTYRVPLLAGLSQMLVSYLLSLLSVYLLSLIIHFLAPKFGGTPNALKALKLAVYGATASLLGGLFALLPSLAVLGVIAGLYSIYLVYLGLPVLMGSPPEKSLAYTAVTIVCAVVLAMVMGAVSNALLPRGILPGGTPFETVRSATIIDTPSGRVSLPEEALEALGRRAAEAAARGDTTLSTDQQAEAMNTAAREILRGAAGSDTSTDSSSVIPPIPDAPDTIATADSAAGDSRYGIGKQKLPPPPSRSQCLSRAERDAALMGSGCDCSCNGYAATPSALCMAACGLAYYGCWAPDPSDAELVAKITDPATRQAIAQMSAEEKRNFQQGARGFEMLSRAAEWEQQQLCPK